LKPKSDELLSGVGVDGIGLISGFALLRGKRFMLEVKLTDLLGMLGLRPRIPRWNDADLRISGCMSAGTLGGFGR
jgi:hypothetical protein